MKWKLVRVENFEDEIIFDFGLRFRSLVVLVIVAYIHLRFRSDIVADLKYLIHTCILRAM